MEHADIRRATRHFLLAFQCSPNKPRKLLSRIVWTYHRAAGKRHLRRALEQAVYVKALHLDLAIPFAIKLGYFPQVIVNYRPFGEQALSLSQMLINWSADELAATYTRTYRNSLLLLHSYGGCVVSYADLTDHSRTGWATALGEITGLSAENLLASRDRRADVVQPAAAEPPVLDQAAQRSITTAIDALSGLAMAPSPQAVRNWRRKMVHPHPVIGPPTWTEWLRIETEAMWRSIRDRRVPWYARAIAALCALVYVIAPIDPIPDSLPVIGHLDDVVMGALLVALFIRLIPSSIVLQHRTNAAARRERRLAQN